MGQLPGGTSCGQIIEAADGTGVWAVKLMGHMWGVTSLVSDLVGCRLATTLGLPVPEVGVMEVSPSWGSHNPHLPCPKGGPIRVVAGPHFCNRYIPGSQDVHALGERFFRQARDLSWTPTLVGFDVWTLNRDRENNQGNLIAVGSAPWDIYVIDQGHCFGGPPRPNADWTSEMLRQRIGIVWRPDLGASRVYGSMQVSWRKEDIRRAIETIRGVSEDTLVEQLESVPDEWLPEHGVELEAMLAFLIQRRGQAVQFLEELWQGGVVGG